MPVSETINPTVSSTIEANVSPESASAGTTEVVTNAAVTVTNGGEDVTNTA